MFESLTDRLSAAFRAMTGQGRLTESNIREGMNLVRQALLEADANVETTRKFVDSVQEKVLGLEVSRALNPTQQILKIVNDELIALMGPVDHSLPEKKPFATIMLCGLQGSGKTTSCGKLGKRLLAAGRNPMFVAADLQRPAAIDQLEVLGGQLGVPVFVDRESKDPVDVCRRALKEAKDKGVDVVILDTAGRLQTQTNLMNELEKIKRVVSKQIPDAPHEVFLVLDATTGQNGLSQARKFTDSVACTGIFLSKLDGTAKGGAAVAIRQKVGLPVKYVGLGESETDFAVFDPDAFVDAMFE